MATDDSQFEAELQDAFLEEAGQMLAEAEQHFLLLETSANPESLETLSRIAHNLKGGARAVGFPAFAELTHALETVFARLAKGEIPLGPPLTQVFLESHDRLRTFLNRLQNERNALCDARDLIEKLEAFREGPSSAAERSEPSVLQPTESSSGPESIRLALERIDALVNDVGELVIQTAALRDQLADNALPGTPLRKTLDQVGRSVRRLQDAAMSLRMVNVGTAFRKMQRIVRDLGIVVGKKVSLRLIGENIQADKNVLELITDPLMHLVNNAIDHGIESAEERALLGKPPEGHVELRAYYRGDRIVIECRDDGRGLDPAKLRAKAMERGLLSVDAVISDEAARELIFHPGFSTASRLTEISGRGVGMDVVRANVRKLGGTVEVESSLGQGTCFRLVLPLNLAIIDGLVVSVGKERYVVPLAHVEEALRPSRRDIEVHEGGQALLHHRGKALPLYHLGNLLGAKGTVKPWLGTVLISNASGEFSVAVDEILSEQQVVTKKLGPELSAARGFSGSTILGDGRATLVMDLGEIISMKEMAA